MGVVVSDRVAWGLGVCRSAAGLRAFGAGRINSPLRCRCSVEGSWADLDKAGGPMDFHFETGFTNFQLIDTLRRTKFCSRNTAKRIENNRKGSRTNLSDLLRISNCIIARYSFTCPLITTIIGITQCSPRCTNLDLYITSTGHCQFLCIANSREYFFKIEALIEIAFGKETRPHHGGENADDDDHHDQLDDCKTALFNHWPALLIEAGWRRE